jgi:hypothetical protein
MSSAGWHRPTSSRGKTHEKINQWLSSAALLLGCVLMGFVLVYGYRVTHLGGFNPPASPDSDLTCTSDGCVPR